MKIKIALTATVAWTLGAFGYSPDLICYCTFDSKESVATPAVGAQGAVVNPVSFVAGVNGNAAQIPAYGGELIRIGLPNGLPVEKGRIEFDAKISTASNSYSDRGNPCFFMVKSATGVNEFSELSFTGNNGLGGSGLYAKLGGLVQRASHCSPTFCSNYSTLLGETTFSDWHHYSIVWNTNGIAGASDKFKVYIDGVEKITYATDFGADPSFAQNMSVASNVYFSRPDTTHNRVGYLIDEFKVWKTDMPTEEPAVVLPVVSEVVAKQHYPWCGKVDISYKVSGAAAGLLVKISVKDNDSGVVYQVKTYDGDLSATVGSHLVVWDANADGVSSASQNMVATVSLVVPED